MTNYTILLPPSEGKNKGGIEEKPYRIVENLKKYNSFITLSFERELIFDTLRKAIGELNTKELEKVFELKEKNLKQATESVLDLLNAPTLPSIERYEGVMFKAINFDTLTSSQKENFNNSILFIDGMFGLLKPQDLIPDYKLKITSKFLDINITKFWKERLRGLLDSLFRDKLIVDILPEAHRKAVTYPTNQNYVTITFAEIKNGKLKQAGHTSKQLKGELVRYIVEKEIISRTYLESFKHSQGFTFSKEYSDEHSIVYLK